MTPEEIRTAVQAANKRFDTTIRESIAANHRAAAECKAAIAAVQSLCPHTSPRVEIFAGCQYRVCADCGAGLPAKGTP